MFDASIEQTQPTAAAEANAVNAENTTPSDDEVDDAFMMMISNKGKRRKRKSKRKEVVHISIITCAPKTDSTALEEPAATSVPSAVEEQSNLIPTEACDVEEECGDLSFFSETHEGQDPVCAENHSSRMMSRLHAGLEKMEQEKEEDMAKINAYLIAKWQEQTDILNKQVVNIRQDLVAKQNSQRMQLAEKHQAQQELEKRKIDEGRKWLLDRQRGELEQKQLELSQQIGKSRNTIIEEWNNISAQLQARHAYQLQQFELKENARKERSANDSNTHIQILEAHHKKRCVEAETVIDDLIKKCQQRQINLKTALYRLHEQRFESKKQEIQVEFSKLESVSQSKFVEYHSHREFAHDHDNFLAHTAVLRHKRRKHIMNGTTVQIAVDIHNEGLFLMARSTCHENENSLSRFGNVSNASPGAGTIVIDDATGRPCLFIPWGAKARSFLYTIVCGEIPSGYGLEQVAVGNSRTQKLLDGGLVKCMLTDTRTSHVTASSDRAEIYPKVQALANSSHYDNISKRVAVGNLRKEELEADIKSISLQEQNDAQVHREAERNLQRSETSFEKLRLQVHHLFGKDGGVPLPAVINADSKQKILSSMYKYKNLYDNARDEEIALRKPLELARMVLISKQEELQKVKQELRILESTSEGYLVDKQADNLINTICQVAQRRRAQVNRRKTTSESNHMNSIPEDEKKSFAQKMVRRRIVTMLRPSQSSIVKEVKEMIGVSPSDKQQYFDSGKCDSSIDPYLRAEELVLLSLYPEAEETLSSVPNETNLNWAEPGWHLNLSPPEGGDPHSILPVDQEGLLSRHFSSVCCSSGRQTASLIQRRHLRMLEGPLSFVSEASAPAQIFPGQKSTTEDMVTTDPLSITEGDLKLGYSFVLRPTKRTFETAQRRSVKRKSSNINKEDATSKKEAKIKRSQPAEASAPRQPAPAPPALEQQIQPLRPNQQVQMMQPPDQQVQMMQPPDQQVQMMQPNQQTPSQMMQPNQQMVLFPNTNAMNRNQFINMTPEQLQQYQLNQQQVQLMQHYQKQQQIHQQMQQQQQTQQQQQMRQQQQIQQMQNSVVNQGQTNNATRSHQQQNTR